MPFIKTADGSLVVSDQLLVLGNESFKRTDDATELMNINGAPAGTPEIVWNGTGAGDTGGDWTRTGVGTETAGAMHAGTNGLDTGEQGGGAQSIFTNGSDFDLDDTYDSFTFWLNPQRVDSGARLEVRWYENSGAKGLALDVADYVTNYDLGVWQKVTIPTADFGLGAILVDEVRFRYVGTGQKKSHWYIDDIELMPAGAGGGPFTFQVAAPDVNTQYHLSMLVFIMGAPGAGWNPNTFGNQTALTNGLLIRHRRISTAEVLWSFNSKDNTDLFGRFHPQDDITFADGTLLIGFMVKPGTASVVVTDDDVLEFVVRDDLSGLSSARGFAHYGVEDITP
jgi:hypothetical protein